MDVRFEKIDISRPLSDYHCDIVFCIKNTKSMVPFQRSILSNIEKMLTTDFPARMLEKDKKLLELRVKMIFYGCSGITKETPWLYPLLDSSLFENIINEIKFDKDDIAEGDGLLALWRAMNIKWSSAVNSERGDVLRHDIVVFDDSECRNLCLYKSDERMPQNIDELFDSWEECKMRFKPGRLLLFAPDGYGWTEVGLNLYPVIHNPVKAGDGLSDLDYQTILSSLVMIV